MLKLEISPPREEISSSPQTDGAGDASGTSYQAAYSRLAASESCVADDLFSGIEDTKSFVGNILQNMSQTNPRIWELLTMAGIDPQISGFIQSLEQAGFTI